MEDPAKYLAGRIRSQFDLSNEATREELLDACRCRGVTVRIVPSFEPGGVYFRRPAPGILLRDACSAEDVGHELCHHIIWENTSNGIEYESPEWWETDEESCARRFAAYVVRG